MKKLFTTLLTSALLMVSCGALADLDYHCLNVCMNNGGMTNKCNKDCTYREIKPLKKQPSSSKKDPHSQFNDQYMDDKVLLPKTPGAGAVPQKDYTCIKACQQSQMSYQYCEQNCLSDKDVSKE